MTLRTELSELKTRLMEEVSQAAHKKDSARVVELSEQLKAVEADLSLIYELDERIGRYKAKLNGKAEYSIGFTVRPPYEQTQDETPRARGKRIRTEFVARHGLTHEKGVVYVTRSGRRVGVATGSKQFLGLPDTHLDVVVLLCESPSGRNDFVIPSEFLQEIWPNLSRSRGQVKFNISVNGSSFLRVPGRGSVDITRFKNRFDLLT